MTLPRALVRPLLVAAFAGFLPVDAAPAPALPAAEPSPAVAIRDDGPTFTLSNGVLTAVIDKQSSDLLSLIYRHEEMVGGLSGHPHGYWSHTPGPDSAVAATVTIDPTANGGERGEVSVKTHADGAKVGQGPGGGAIVDVEIRYALGRGDAALYTYSIFTHPPTAPATQLGEARFAAKLTPGLFDFMTVDGRRRRLMPTPEDWDRGTPLNMKEARRLNTGRYRGEVEHKYDYTADQFATRTFGWSSTTRHLGFWIVNPSTEYLSSGPTKYELMAHLDGSERGGAAPTVLNYWRSSHYGGSVCAIAQGEAWTKVVGPFLLYCNSAPDQDALWHDALAEEKRASAAWPYDWVNGVDYPHRAERSRVTGRIVLHDPQAPGQKLDRLLVGLAAPAYTVNDRRGGAMPVRWDNDAKHYEFWVRGDASGAFTLPNVRAGRYTLYAIADGVLGEFAKTDIAIGPGQSLDLGRLDWQPVRYGRQLWDIGLPNRNASEFLQGDDYWHWGMYLRYSKLFPHDVHYTIGQSDYRKDWYIYQVPHVAVDNGTGRTQGASTTWSIRFDLPAAPVGRAILRLALCGVGARRLDVTVNDHAAGTVSDLVYNATINRDGIQGSWVEKDVTFDAALMQRGTNVLNLTIPGGSPTSGIAYDYLRLELANP